MYTKDNRNYFWCWESVFVAAVARVFIHVMQALLEHNREAKENYARIIARKSG